MAELEISLFITEVHMSYAIWVQDPHPCVCPRLRAILTLLSHSSGSIRMEVSENDTLIAIVYNDVQKCFLINQNANVTELFVTCLTADCDSQVHTVEKKLKSTQRVDPESQPGAAGCLPSSSPPPQGKPT